ncbi:TetR/AcrR family transcriptional regulator [Amycolatopsis magusensis]|uniref:AcrR family transcriptional regulator n=1 Tax=Amycolatopsis magusensis TaxID=882444 RepID=A0ABS4PUZ9_9PSEU|nr:TetR family transcriptional regulator [Amycolatopsis magusensis]MBP2183262.1 AcrR family transcriptional regulator [Amycolatopsis magusensis]
MPPETTSSRIKRDRAATRARLLDAARLRFARDGFDGTSVRDVAGDAAVDPALVFRYFGSKKKLFDEATAVPEPAAELFGGPREELPARLLGSIAFQDWPSHAGEHPLIAMLRSSGHAETRERLREEVCETYVRALAELTGGGPDGDLRAELFSAWMLGIGVLRSVIGTPAITGATPEDLEPHLEKVIAALLERG